MKNTLMDNIRITRLKILCYGLLLGVLFSSCDDDEAFDNQSIWTPILNVEKGDGQTTLFLIDPRPFSLYAGPVPSNPDYFNILISENLENFALHSKVDVESNSVKIENLTNGKPYYFVVTSHKGRTTVPSDTVMIIPSEEAEREVYLATGDLAALHASTSFDLRYSSFVHQDKLYLKHEGDNPTVIEEDVSSANWSPLTNTLAYMKSTQVGSTIYPFALRLYDAQTGISTEVLEVPYNNYYVSNPSFTPEGDIAFLSSENNAAKEAYELWKINPETKEKTLLSDFERIGFNMNYGYDWSASGEEVYLDGWFEPGNHGIYKFNLSTKILTPIIQSGWHDRDPSRSPDETKIAFISDRSGEYELWIYDMTDSKYIQVTGEASYHFDSRYTSLQWLSNEEMLITIFEDSKSKAVKIKVN